MVGVHGKQIRFSVLVLFLFVVSCYSFTEKFHPHLIELFQQQENVEQSFFVSFAEFSEFPPPKATEVEYEKYIQGKIKHAEQSQSMFLPFLEDLGITRFKTFWISNCIEVKSDLSRAMLIAKHQQVIRIEPNVRSPQFLPGAPSEQKSLQNEKGVEEIVSNLNWIRIPEVWELGLRGEGIVIATADTGVQWNHPALAKQYRGYDTITGEVDHDYNWWDAVHEASASNLCGNDSKEPCDDNGHGTHTIGSAVGSDGVNQIGVAPNAKWIACRNMQSGFGSPAGYIECLQFFIAPTDINGNNPQVSKRPHVIINSYACPPGEGCTDVSVLKNSVNSVVAAGIFMSVAVGNTGSLCGTVNTPPAIYEASFTVGAAEENSNALASFSSRGPSGSSVKPDIIAPGVNIKSSYPFNGYRALSGTSMAAPQIAGVVALISQSNSFIERDIDEIRFILENSANAIQSSGCDSSTLIPNNLYGYGMVDAFEAVQQAQQIEVTTSSPSRSPTQTPTPTSDNPVSYSESSGYTSNTMSTHVTNDSSKANLDSYNVENTTQTQCSSASTATFSFVAFIITILVA